MMTRDLSWRAAALAASLLLHFAALFAWSERQLISLKETDQPPNNLFVQISFPQAQPENQMPVAEPPPEKAPPPPKPPPKPKPKPKPVVKKRPTPQPIVEPPLKPQPVAEAPAPAPLPPPSASRQLTDLRNAYVTELLAKIEKNKFYPTIARRRNLQGKIKVRFRLGCRGEVQGLEIDGKHSLLRKAAGKAIDASLPLPKIPAEIECPMQIDYAMAYSLDE